MKRLLCTALIFSALFMMTACGGGNTEMKMKVEVGGAAFIATLEKMRR